VANWQDERNGAALYRAISEVEKNPQLKSVYQRLRRLRRDIRFWEAKLRAPDNSFHLSNSLAYAHAQSSSPGA